MRQEWDWPPRRHHRWPDDVELKRQSASPSGWNSPAGKMAGQVSLGVVVFSFKVVFAIALGLVIAAGFSFLRLLATV